MAGKAAMGRGDVATLLLMAAVNGAGFPEGQVPDTPDNRALFAEIDDAQKAVAASGLIPDIPFDYSGI